MVHAIVRQSGGHVNIESAPGKGTTFKVYFPRQADLSAAPMPSLTAPARATVTGEGIVLLAEDDRAVRRLVVTELTRRGFTVLEAEDGASALELFNKEKDRVDILVTDVVMPRMNGADLAKNAERIRPGLKILFISGHPERAGQGLDPTGVTNLLMKPFTADTLAARIKEMITGRKEADGWRCLKHRRATRRKVRVAGPRSAALGKWDLTAIGVNQVIGSAIFLLPSDVAARVGPWGPLAFMAVGLLSLSIALCFAEVGSRFETTGGPYLPARAAFGRFVGFEVGWMMWFSRVTSHASVVNGLTLALAFYWPPLANGIPRAATITALTLVLTWITSAASSSHRGS
jgi:CheY-like chemotaxis protein